MAGLRVEFIFEDLNWTKIVADLRESADRFEGRSVTSSPEFYQKTVADNAKLSPQPTAEVAPPPADASPEIKAAIEKRQKRRGRPPAQPTVTPPPVSTETLDDEDLDDTPPEEDDESLGIEETPKAKALDFDDVLESFRSYVSKHGLSGKVKAKEILGRFGVTSVRDLKPDQYALAIKATAV